MNNYVCFTAECFENIREWLATSINLSYNSTVLTTLLLIAALILSVLGYYISLPILRMIARIVEKTETDWDDDLINPRLLKALSLLTPALIAEWLIPHSFINPGGFSLSLHLLFSFYIIGVTIFAVNTLLDNLHNAFSKREKFKPFAIKGIFQMGKLIAIGIGIIIGLSLIVGKSPIAILTALGASAAILMLVFKDTILGLVASVQLTANNMVKVGDWIIVPKHNANGEVVDISLTIVKIRNWDNSITTIPPYSLISESFQNFQEMRDSNARRVSRSLIIDIKSINFLSEDQLERLSKNPLINSHLFKSDTSVPNIRLYREYMENWLYENPMVREDKILMVRQMEPTSNGLPLDFYFFLSEVKWKEFEHIQSDIFDHIYATAPLFGLKLYQAPSGEDIRSLAKTKG